MVTLKTLTEKLARLKVERQAVILAHNYQIGEVQDVADFVGDSLALSQQAAGTDAQVILFAGVHFMAETAKLLCPEKTVLVPDLNAGCPMANMIATRELAERKNEHPDAAVVCYVNSSAAIKAMSDICCTSANAVKVVQSLSQEHVLFVPDRNLGSYVAQQTDKDVIL
ncbi:MAG: quinolinate synthase NadA, partial [Planctomycetes bacterium]|nr:quinolinate synthase NadA [Planctomycetota bacterium]